MEKKVENKEVKETKPRRCCCGKRTSKKDDNK